MWADENQESFIIPLFSMSEKHFVLMVKKGIEENVMHMKSLQVAKSILDEIIIKKKIWHKYISHKHCIVNISIVKQYSLTIARNT